ncbi:retrovirus-related pol polyprotein from transposon TNT 1-94 [Tanacetum coccineum]
MVVMSAYLMCLAACALTSAAQEALQVCQEMVKKVRDCVKTKSHIIDYSETMRQDRIRSNTGCHSTLTGLDLLQYIDGTLAIPSQFSDNERKTINPAYTRWYRQDQTLLSVILDMIQPIISSASSSKEAWERLLHSYANASRSSIISLISKLAKNPKGNKLSVAEFLNEMRSIADELALIQNPICEEDLVVHIITQLGDEFNSLVAAIKV